LKTTLGALHLIIPPIIVKAPYRYAFNAQYHVEIGIDTSRDQSKLTAHPLQLQLQLQPKSQKRLRRYQEKHVLCDCTPMNAAKEM
jgi:hypothetical protein